jgi:hypothetical protein
MDDQYHDAEARTVWRTTDWGKCPVCGVPVTFYTTVETPEPNPFPAAPGFLGLQRQWVAHGEVRISFDNLDQTDSPIVGSLADMPKYVAWLHQFAEGQAGANQR